MFWLLGFLFFSAILPHWLAKNFLSFFSDLTPLTCNALLPFSLYKSSSLWLFPGHCNIACILSWPCRTGDRGQTLAFLGNSEKSLILWYGPWLETNVHEIDITNRFTKFLVHHLNFNKPFEILRAEIDQPKHKYAYLASIFGLALNI